MSNYFTELTQAGAHVDKKGKLSYVSWIEAWAQLKHRHPFASYEIVRTPDGGFLHGEGFAVTRVTVPVDIAPPQGGATFEREVTHEMWLPVMDHKNNQIQKPSTTDINKAVMRCLTKCIAMHGVGSFVYMGEDLPVSPPDRSVNVAEGDPHFWKKYYKREAEPRGVSVDDFAALLKECENDVDAVKARVEGEEQ